MQHWVADPQLCALMNVWYGRIVDLSESVTEEGMSLEENQVLFKEKMVNGVFGK